MSALRSSHFAFYAMQLKTLVLSAVIAATSAHGLILNTPAEPIVTGEPLEVTFEDQPGDSDFTLLLKNVETGISQALVAVIDPTQESFTITFPCVDAKK